MADRILVVCTPELNTLRDVRECQRVFGEIIHLDGKRVNFIFNHNQPFSVLAREQFESALEQEMSFELPHAGEAAYKAGNRGEPLVLSHGGSAYSKAVEKIVQAIVPAEPKGTKRSLNVVHHATAARGATAGRRPANGLLGVLRGKRAS